MPTPLRKGGVDSGNRWGAGRPGFANGVSAIQLRDEGEGPQSRAVHQLMRRVLLFPTVKGSGRVTRFRGRSLAIGARHPPVSVRMPASPRRRTTDRRKGRYTPLSPVCLTGPTHWLEFQNDCKTRAGAPASRSAPSKTKTDKSLEQNAEFHSLQPGPLASKHWLLGAQRHATGFPTTVDRMLHLSFRSY
jgi:hypothetical protein